MEDVRKALCLGSVALALVVAGSASARAPETTRPGVVYRVNVSVTDRRVLLEHARYARGAIIRYYVTNRGTRPYRFVIVGVSTDPIPPRRTHRVLVNWNYRGRYVYKTQVRRGGRWRDTGARGWVTIY